MARPVQAQRSKNDSQLRIASLNVWGLREPLARDVIPRMLAIGRALPGLNADIITFQEVWTAQAGQILSEAGMQAGLIHQFDAQALTGGSGLLVMARHPISQSRFEPYWMGGLPERILHGDYWGAKGYILAQITTPIGEIALADTHLHAQYDPDRFPSYPAHRMGQIVQLAAGLSRLAVPVIAAGDFNMRDQSPEYRAFNGLTGMRDCAAERGNPQPTSLDSNPYHTGRARGDSRIDYIFARDGLDSAIEVIAAKRIFDSDLEIDGHRVAYSDHAGMLVDVSIRNQSGLAHNPSLAAIELARTGIAIGQDLAESRRHRERWGALAGLGVGSLAIASRRNERIERRRFLRALLAGVATLGAGSALGLAGLSEFAVVEELENYRAVERLLDELVTEKPLRH